MTDSETPTFAALAAVASGDTANVHEFMTPSSIEATQAAATADLIARFDRLPAELSRGEPARAFLEAHGFRVTGQPDALCLAVVPPKGWSLREGWTSTVLEALDADGHVRFNFQHKVAAYDPRADIRPTPRYRTLLEYLDANGDRAPDSRSPGCVAIRFAVSDETGPVPYRTASVPKPDPRNCPDGAWNAYTTAAEAAEADAWAWLDANRPNWRDPAMSWRDGPSAAR